MIYVQYIAGFGPKDLMALYYVPAVFLLIVTSLVLFIIKRGKVNPYPLALLVFPIAAPLWYLYDRQILKKSNKSQSVLLMGCLAIVGLCAIAYSPIVPESFTATDIIAIIANIFAIIISVVAIRWRNQ